MSLRDQNPYIDSDLSLIITTFEKAMNSSNVEDAVLVPFRRSISSFAGIPRTTIETISSLPAFQPSVGEGDIAGMPRRESSLNDDDERREEELSPSEDADNQDKWIDKAKEWFSDCVPCDFRSLSKYDPNFLESIKGEWNASFKKIEASLDNFENNLLNSETVFSSLCDIASQLKPHCIPDLKKIVWLLNFLLSKLNKEFEVNLNIFDSLITSILSPIINAMIGNLDLVDSLALAPIRCVIDQIDLTIRELTVNLTKPAIQIPPVLVNLRNRVEDQQQRAETLRQETIASSRINQSTQKVSGFLNQVNNQFDFDILKNYIQVGTQYIENYKSWLINLFQDLIGQEVDNWNEKIGLSGKKLDLIRLVGVINSMIKASKDGAFVCGPEEDGLTKDEFRTLVDSYVNPNTPLEISIEDDNLIIRRDRRQQELNESDAEASVINASGNVTERSIPSNVVLSKPISACLKNVTVEEYSKVELWIRQLEDTD